MWTVYWTQSYSILKMETDPVDGGWEALILRLSYYISMVKAVALRCSSLFYKHRPRYTVVVYCAVEQDTHILRRINTICLFNITIARGNDPGKMLRSICSGGSCKVDNQRVMKNEKYQQFCFIFHYLLFSSSIYDFIDNMFVGTLLIFL